MRFLRSLPVPICWAIIATAILPIFGALRGGIWSLVVGDKLLGALIDAVQGMIGGYLMGWYYVRSIGLPRSATSFDFVAAAKAKELK